MKIILNLIENMDELVANDYKLIQESNNPQRKNDLVCSNCGAYGKNYRYDNYIICKICMYQQTIHKSYDQDEINEEDSKHNSVLDRHKLGTRMRANRKLCRLARNYNWGMMTHDDTIIRSTRGLLDNA